MEELHGPSFLTSLYWLFGKGYFDITHEMQIEHKKIYGPLWKSKYGPLVVVNVASADLIEQVLRQEGKLPVRSDMPHWREYRQLRRQAYGPLTEMGPEWQRIRSILNPRMLKPRHVSSYSPAINQRSVSDPLPWVCLHLITVPPGPGLITVPPGLITVPPGPGLITVPPGPGLITVPPGLITVRPGPGICSVLFETRMGCLNDHVPEETQKFIESVGEMFRLSSVVVLFPKSLWPYLPFWKHFVVVWDHLFRIAKMLIDSKVKEIQGKMEKGEPVEGEYLTHLLTSDKMSVTEIQGSITELLLAGVDTTSNTISWALYHLAREPEIQETLYEEVKSVCPGNKIPAAEDIAKMAWLKATVKETLRNTVQQGCVFEVVCSVQLLLLFQTLFHLCHYAVSYEESNFPEPHVFRPERWLRGEDRLKQHPFGSIPFGFGIRACLGRRVAELEHPFGSIPFGFGIRACLGRRVAELEMYCVLSRDGICQFKLAC
ncbi:UNVERIFIED_CONTAM: hypothetical protein FKN15_058114 [Acipenser sinensis]